MSQPPITIAVRAKYPLDQAGLEALVERLPGLRLIEKNADALPHVLLWDAQLGMPPGSPSSVAVLIVADPEQDLGIPLGTTGLFSRDETAEALATAIRQVARGHQYLSVSLAKRLLAHHAEAAPTVDLNGLTEREREVLALLGEGLSNKAIAARLYLSVRTVEGHLANLYARLNAHSRLEAVLIAQQHNSLAPPPPKSGSFT